MSLHRISFIGLLLGPWPQAVILLGLNSFICKMGRVITTWKSVLNIHWKDWCWSWNSNTLATWCELTHWKRPWCWEWLKAGREGDDREWDGWMASVTQWTWDWVNSRSWWWTGRPGVLQSMGSQRFGHDWMTELNWITTWFLKLSESNNTCENTFAKVSSKLFI